MDRLVVSNQTLVKVFLKSDPNKVLKPSVEAFLVYCFLLGSLTMKLCFPPLQSRLCFTIGSVESFERNLEAVQQEMNVDPTFWVPVTYVKESEWL